MLRAGYEAEKQLAFYLDRAFREEAYIRIFHGLRLQRDVDVAQIDHLVLHRFGFVIIESKSISESVVVNEHGEFTRTYRGKRQGMPSPVKQAQLQTDLLSRLLNDHKKALRPIMRLGPIKRQPSYTPKRFIQIAAISDRGEIRCAAERPAEVMKAEAVVEAVRAKIAYQELLVSAAGFARVVVDTYTNPKRAKEWDENLLHPFIDEEMDSITDFLLQRHTPADGVKQRVAAPIKERKVVAQSDQRAAASPSSPKSTPPPQRAAKSSNNEPQAEVSQPLTRSMAKWSAAEEQQLRDAFTSGAKPQALSATFGRTPWALRLRAQKIGLISNVKEWQ